MKKQKLLYEEPVWRKLLLPDKIENISSIPVKSRKLILNKGHSEHKKFQPTELTNQLQDYQKDRYQQEKHHQNYQSQGKLVQFNIRKDMLSRKQNNSTIEKKCVKQEQKGRQSRLKIRQSEQKKSLKYHSKQVSSKKVNTSTALSKKQLLETRQLNIKNFALSPYLKNISDITKIMKMLKPVKGPNESVKKQIIHYNDLNKKNHELVMMRKPNQTFQSKRQMYLERIGLKPDSKVFVMNSRDQHIRETLISRGWIELQDISDAFFHLKWVYSDSKSDYDNLNRSQLFNHFYNNQQLTNKNNLRKNVKLAPEADQPQIPLTFDLGINQQYKKFIQISTFFEGVKTLNMIVKILRMYDSNVYNRIIKNPNYFKFFNTLGNIETKHNRLKLKQFFDDRNQNEQMQVFEENVIEFLSLLIRQLKKSSTIKYSLFNEDEKNTNCLIFFDYFKKVLLDRNSIDLLCRIPKFLKVEILKLHFHFMNEKTAYKKSYGTQNVWIIKPTGVSRGTGIHIESDYRKMLYQSNNQHGKIFQKYIEKPFLLKDQRKFDIRQWVLVKSFNPLQAYMYRRLYGRICPQKYIQEDFQNIQRHLTNYSLSKDFYKGKNSNIPNVEQSSVLFNYVGLKKGTPSSIILEQALVEQINDRKKPTGVSWSEIKLQIKQNILKTLKCCDYQIQSNPNCFQVYGFDILLDQDLNVYVIQVNLSPACENREGLDVYLDEMSDGLIDYVEQWANLEKNVSDSARKSKKEVWERLDQKEIKKELESLKEGKIKQQKVILIQKWVRNKFTKKITLSKNTTEQF